MKEIQLTKGKVALVDDEDYEGLSRFKWCAQKSRNTYYAVRNSSRDTNGKGHKIRMHRVIMDTPDGMLTDHIDGNGLNNQRSNLRICTMAENQQNQGKQQHNTSGFKGVSFHTHTKKWRACISVAGKQHYLGYFTTKEEAYEAYCKACIELHGGFARTM